MAADLSKLKILPTLPPEQLYVYVIENSDGITNKIKIGVTHNPFQRLTSLSGSNGGGSKITRYSVSPATYLYTLERICHEHFSKYRVKGTEWFVGVSMEEAVDYVRSLFSSTEYKVCNEIRKQLVEDNKIDLEVKDT